MLAIIRTRWHTRPLSRRAKPRSSAAPGSLRKKYTGIVHPQTWYTYLTTLLHLGITRNPYNLAAAATVPSTFSAWASACFLYSIGVYSSGLGATESKWYGSVTVTAVILAPISLANWTPCSTALVARSDPSVGIRIFLYKKSFSDLCSFY